ncbi:MAG: DUF378 domain-containing protein [Patescibacteria group bacterium]
MKDKGCMMSTVGFWFLVVGAVNWGLVGLGNFFGADDGWNVIHLVFEFLPWLEWAIYVVVGICGVLLAFGCKCDKCKVDSGAGGSQPM